MTALTRQMDFSDTQLIDKALFHAICNIMAHFLLLKEYEREFA